MPRVRGGRDEGRTSRDTALSDELKAMPRVEGLWWLELTNWLTQNPVSRLSTPRMGVT